MNTDIPGWERSEALTVSKQLPLTPPCNLTMNRVSIGGGNPNYSYNQITGPDADNVVSRNLLQRGLP